MAENERKDDLALKTWADDLRWTLDYQRFKCHLPTYTKGVGIWGDTPKPGHEYGSTFSYL